MLYALEEVRRAGETASCPLHTLQYDCGNALAADSLSRAIQVIISGHDPILHVDVVGSGLASLETHNPTMITTIKGYDLAFSCEGPCGREGVEVGLGAGVAEADALHGEALA